MKKLIFLFNALFLLGACSSNKMLTADEEATFELQKTSCYGTCPVYTLRLAEDGRARLRAEEHMDKQGIYKANFPKGEILALIDDFEQANFAAFKTEYTSTRSDLPTTYITFGDMKIMNYDGAPESLEKLQKKLEAFVDRPEWEKVADLNAK
mgnify:CR=1 FL=1